MQSTVLPVLYRHSSTYFTVRTKLNYKKPEIKDSDLPMVCNNDNDCPSSVVGEVSQQPAVQDLVHFVFDDESFRRFNE